MQGANSKAVAAKERKEDKKEKEEGKKAKQVGATPVAKSGATLKHRT